MARSSFKTAGDWLNLRSLRSKLCLSPSLSGFETASSEVVDVRAAGQLGTLTAEGYVVPTDIKPVVALSGVGKSYIRGNTATSVLENVDLVANRGECIFLIGPSGCGKSTLLSIIGCVLTADCGDVRILGEDVGGLTRDEAAQLRLEHIGFVFQRFHLIRGLSAAENVALPLRLAGWTATSARRRASDLLAMVELSDKLDVQPKHLSVGQCQRVALARALAADPQLILADEPTASLDAKTGRQALELLRRLTVDTGKTVIVVTHDQRILPFADRILQLENGRLYKEPAGQDNHAVAAVDRVQDLLAAF